jgi:hypothetical protein
VIGAPCIREDDLLIDKLNITRFAYGPTELGEADAVGLCTHPEEINHV